MNKLTTRGFSLLEVLITMLLVTVGVLGMVAMQGRAIQYSQDSVERTHAATLAYELLEMVRASPSGLDVANSPLLFSSLPASGSSTCFEIDTNALLEEQIGCWASRARTLLPGADSLASRFEACISAAPGVCDPTGSGAALEVRMAWNASGEGCLDASDLDGALCTFTFRTQI